MSDALVSAIHSGDRAEALRAARADLSAEGAAGLADAIVRLLSDERAWTREGAIDLLRAIEPDAALIDRLAATLRSGDHADHRNAARSALAALATPGAVDPAAPLARLAALLADDADGDVRILSANALGESGNLRGRAALERALDDPEPNVVAAAAEALGALDDPRAVEALIALARREDFWTRAAAIAALGSLRDRRAIPVLSDLADDPWLAGAVARALAQIGDPAGLEALRTTLSLDGEARDEAFRAATQLVAAGHEPAVPAWLREALRGEERTVLDRPEAGDDEAAARILGIVGTREAADALIDAIVAGRGDSAALGVVLLPRTLRSERLLARLESDVEGGALASIIGLLPGLDGRAAIERVADHLNQADGEVRTAAGRVLLRSDPALVIDVLRPRQGEVAARIGLALAYGRLGEAGCEARRELLRDADPRVRAAAAEGRGGCGGEFVGALRQALREETDESARAALMRALAEEGGDEAVAALGAMLNAAEPALRYEAVRALGRSGTESALPLLLDSLNDPHPGIRTVALAALGNLGDARAEAPLASHAHDPDRDRRRIATTAIARLLGNDAIDRLVAALQDSDREVRLVAIAAIGKLRPPGLLPRMERLAEDDADPLVRRAAASVAAALQQIAGGTV